MPLPPYREGELLILAVEGMEAQVEHQGCHGVEEGEDPQGHEELGGGRKVTHQVEGEGLRLLLLPAGWHLEGDLV